jgi:four helix bundle protein
MPELFDKRGGFRRLHSFTLATIVQLETLRFCRRFITQDPRESGAKFYDPKGRQYDQMTQAARSGRQNIIEGSERSATSKDTEMKLTDVARASLSELRGDYEIPIVTAKEKEMNSKKLTARVLGLVLLALASAGQSAEPTKTASADGPAISA